MARCSCSINSATSSPLNLTDGQSRLAGDRILVDFFDGLDGVDDRQQRTHFVDHGGPPACLVQIHSVVHGVPGRLLGSPYSGIFARSGRGASAGSAGPCVTWKFHPSRSNARCGGIHCTRSPTNGARSDSWQWGQGRSRRPRLLDQRMPSRLSCWVSTSIFTSSCSTSLSISVCCCSRKTSSTVISAFRKRSSRSGAMIRLWVFA